MASDDNTTAAKYPLMKPDFQRLRKLVRHEGGYTLQGRHRGRPVHDYNGKETRTKTCGCGNPTMMMVPYQSPDLIGKADLSDPGDPHSAQRPNAEQNHKQTPLCAVCDAIHVTPRFRLHSTK